MCVSETRMIDNGQVKFPCKSGKGLIALHSSVTMSTEFVHLILCDLKTWDIMKGDNRTSLSYAALGGNVGIVNVLLAKGANVEAKTKVLPMT